MEQYTDLLQKSALFCGIAPQDMRSLLECLSASRREYEKGETIWRQGAPVPSMGLVLSGSVHIAREDFWGNHSILSDAGPGALFGESYACLPEEALRVDVIAAQKSAVLFLDVGRMLAPCGRACAFHTRMMRNLLMETARRNLTLTRKMAHLSERTTREKLLSYLSEQSAAQGKATFAIVFNRQQLADYLCVDRSAMSSELGRLRDEGVLRFEKNRFTLLPRP